MFLLGNKFNISLIIKMKRNDSMCNLWHSHLRGIWLFWDAWLPRSFWGGGERSKETRDSSWVSATNLHYLSKLEIFSSNKGLGLSDATRHCVKSIGEKLKSINSMCIVREPIKFSEWKPLNDYLHIYKMRQWTHF